MIDYCNFLPSLFSLWKYKALLSEPVILTSFLLVPYHPDQLPKYVLLLRVPPFSVLS